jgi:hypothetical protein
MGEYLYGNYMKVKIINKIFVNIVLIFYLIGVLIIKGIIGSESLKFGIIYLISKEE